MSTQTYTGKLQVVTCYRCSMAFGLDYDFYERKIRERTDFYCPAGHCQHFLVETYEEQLARERRRAAAAEGRAQRAENSHRTMKGHLTRIKRRVAHGVCPCCKRTFKDLAAHMQTKHPSYVKEPASP